MTLCYALRDILMWAKGEAVCSLFLSPCLSFLMCLSVSVPFSRVSVGVASRNARSLKNNSLQAHACVSTWVEERPKAATSWAVKLETLMAFEVSCYYGARRLRWAGPCLSGSGSELVVTTVFETQSTAEEPRAGVSPRQASGSSGQDLGCGISQVQV